jgi:MoxR-like ATPase
VPEAVGRYIVALGRKTREIPGVELGVSSRAMIHLVSAAKANARLYGRLAVTIEDVREMAPYVLRHRIIVQPGVSRDQVLLDAMGSLPAPVPDPVPGPVQLS